jgi:hypothetical protein
MFKKNSFRIKKSYWLRTGAGVSDNETSYAVTNRATEQALGRGDDCKKQAMLSYAKLFYISIVACSIFYALQEYEKLFFTLWYDGLRLFLQCWRTFKIRG